jgi:hypothetical protein
VHQYAGAVHVPGGGQQALAEPVEVLCQDVHDGQGGVGLQPSHRRQLVLHNGCKVLAVAADHPGLAGCGGALVEADGVEALRPSGVLGAQVVVELQQGPPFQHRRGWDVAGR